MGDNRGRVTSRAKCPKCGKQAWDLTGEHGFDLLQCRNCGQLSNKLPIIRLSWANSDHTIIYDHHGRRLATVEDAVTELKLIRQSILAEDFDPEDYAGKTRGSNFWANWLDKQEAREKSRVEAGEIAASTHRKRRALWRHLKGAFDLNIKEIKYRHIEDWLLGVRLSQKYRRDMVEELGRLFNLAYRRREIDRVPHLPQVRVDEKPIRFLTEEKQAQVLEQIQEIHRPVYRFYFEHGLRPAEVCALCWDMVDLDGRIFYVARTLQDRRLVDTTKGRSAMAMPITTLDQVLIEEALTAAKRDGIIPAGQVPVFRNQEADLNRNPSQRYLPDFLNSRWNRAVAAVGLAPIRLYSGRHSRAMQLKRDKVPDETIARTLGQRSTAHTRKYARTDVSIVRDVLDPDSED